jgi:hypothetical protein
MGKSVPNPHQKDQLNRLYLLIRNRGKNQRYTDSPCRQVEHEGILFIFVN